MLLHDSVGSQWTIRAVVKHFGLHSPALLPCVSMLHASPLRLSCRLETAVSIPRICLAYSRHFSCLLADPTQGDFCSPLPPHHHHTFPSSPASCGTSWGNARLSDVFDSSGRPVAGDKRRMAPPPSCWRGAGMLRLRHSTEPFVNDISW